MKPPGEEFRERLRKERILFVKLSAEWVLPIPKEVWSRKHAECINSLFSNRNAYLLTRDKYLSMIEAARPAFRCRRGTPPMPESARMFSGKTIRQHVTGTEKWV